jgi:hypothetical protein
MKRFSVQKGNFKRDTFFKIPTIKEIKKKKQQNRTEQWHINFFIFSQHQN